MHKRDFDRPSNLQCRLFGHKLTREKRGYHTTAGSSPFRTDFWDEYWESCKRCKYARTIALFDRTVFD